SRLGVLPSRDFSNTMTIHTEHFMTRQHELGPDRLVRVQCICNYMEEAAGKHADSLGVGLARLQKENLAWVLVKMRLCLNARPGAECPVRVDTWPVSVERAQFRRDFLLFDANDHVLATAVTQWVVMGTQSRKIERLPEYIMELQPENPPKAQDDGDIRIHAVQSEAVPGPVFPVRLADIDQNLHVNNGRYVDFSLEAADVFMHGAPVHEPVASPAHTTALPRQNLGRLDLIFRAEAVRGDEVCSYTQAEAAVPGSYVHSLRRRSDGAELARSRTVFAP
ncbi:hypothetical protein LJC46_02670, partial [Desulfovibrio sp. OttesenSCG-928-G15]|nr:hypothetical protein [Desulfovibrio sp. OttesenSCG-928-G15]